MHRATRNETYYPDTPVLKGSGTIGDKEDLPHTAFHTLVLSGEPQETGVKLTAVEDHTEFVLVRLQHSYALVSSIYQSPSDCRRAP